MKLLRFLSLWCCILITALVAAKYGEVALASQAVLPDAHMAAEGGDPQLAGQKPAVSFAKAVNYDSDGDAASIAIGDVNGDGRPDMVVVNGGVGVLLGNGDGTFQAAVSYSSGGYSPTSVAIADLNGDGKLDLVVSNWCQSGGNCGNGGVSVLLGNGDGTFQAPVSYDSGGTEATSVAIADLNGDGKPDLVVSNYCSLLNCDNGVVSVFLGNGDGTFQAPISFSLGGRGSGASEGIAVGDFNGDGNPDLAVVGAGYISVFLGNGDGTFQAPVSHSCFVNSIAIGDVNRDGKLDLIVTGFNFVTIFLGNGDGTFQAPALHGSGGYTPTSVAIGDVNGDGNPDLIVANTCKIKLACVRNPEGDVSVLSGNGDGSFQVAVHFKSGGDGDNHLVVLADINGDTKPDVLVTNLCQNGCVGVLLNNLSVRTTTALTSSVNPSQINESVTFTATIASALAIPDGQVVTFYNGKLKVGTGTTTKGKATFTTSFSAAKSYIIKASYPGDRYHKPSSGTVTQVVNP